MCETLPCVCNICNCGKHKCPHKLRRPGPWDKCVLSEYNRHYTPHDICPTKSLKPTYTSILGDGPLSDQTTHRIDYIPKCAEMPHLYKPPDYVKPEGRIDDMTMYKKEFGPKEACPPILIKPIPRRSVPAKFEGETSNRRDFQRWDLPKVHIHKEPPFIPCEDKFDGLSSHHRDYVPHCVMPSKSFKPKSSFMQSDEPLSQETDYKQSYIVHPLDPAVTKKETCIVSSRVPLDSLTTHKKEFTPKEICLQKSCKPKPHYIQVDKPLSQETTHRVDYRPHDTEAPFKHEQQKYIKPDIDMDLKTTYNKDFIDLPACRVNSIRPAPIRQVAAPFDQQTSYKDAFKKWDVAPSRPTMKDNFVPCADPFEDCTTSKLAFVPHEICPVKSFKPAPHMLSNDPFDDATMYRTEYTKKCQPYCPAAYLDTNSRSVSPDGYIYHCEDTRGHLHYRKSSVPVTGAQDKGDAGVEKIIPEVLKPVLKT